MSSHTILGSMLCAVLCILAVTACGGSGTTVTGTATHATGYSSPVGLSRCMRANGLPRFPDPTSGPGGEGFNGIGVPVGGPLDSIIVDGTTFSGPAAARAIKACAKYVEPSGPPPAPTARQKAQALAMARCMRANGVPNFPDPDFSGAGGGAPAQQSVPDASSPAFRHAVNICGHGRRISLVG